MHLIPPPHTTPSFAKSAIPLLLTIKPSRVALTVIVVLHLLALYALSLAAISPLFVAGLGVLVIASGVYNINHELRSRQLIWRAGDHWIINDDPDQPRTAQLKAIDFLSRWLVIITLREDNHKSVHLVIPFDSVDSNTFRLFRVRLRLEGHALLNPQDEQ